MGGLFGSSKGSGASQSQQQLDPDIKRLYMENYAGARDLANSLPNLRNNPDYWAGQDYLRGTLTGQAGINTIDQSARTAGGLQNFEAGDVRAAQAQYRGYDPLYGNAAQLSGADIANYTNPYTQQVIDATMADQQRARAVSSQNDNVEAIRNKAFGGSRADLTRVVRDTERERADTANLAGMRNAAFDSAVKAAQSDVANRQNMTLANLGYGNEAAQFGANAFNTNSLSNAQLRQQASLANQDARIKSAGVRGTAAELGGRLGESQFKNRLAAGMALRDLGMGDFNLALQRQAIINQALGLNPAGGSGVQSSSETQGKGLFDYIFA